MNTQLWGRNPHSSFVVFDSASQLEKLKNSKLAMQLMLERASLKNSLEVLSWLKRAMALLGSANDLNIQNNESIQILEKISKGVFDSQGESILFNTMEKRVYELEDSEILTGKAAEVAHLAISHWAELERASNV